MNVKLTGEYFLEKEWKKFSSISEASLSEILLDNNLDLDDIQIFKIEIEYYTHSIQIQDNWSNCGVNDICNFGFNPYTSRGVLSLTKKIEELKEKYELSGNFLMGTINDTQKQIFGEVFEKCGWKIVELFVNDNGNQQCYLITKKLFE